MKVQRQCHCRYCSISWALKSSDRVYTHWCKGMPGVLAVARWMVRFTNCYTRFYTCPCTYEGVRETFMTVTLGAKSSWSRCSCIETEHSTREETVKPIEDKTRGSWCSNHWWYQWTCEWSALFEDTRWEPFFWRTTLLHTWINKPTG